MMREAILNFAKQFEYQPEIINRNKLDGFDKFIIIGMGGSNLAGGFLKILDPYFDVIIHKGYGLPAIPKHELDSRLIIASSYSGNTEETVGAFAQAVSGNFPVAALSTGGRLIELAEDHGKPYIKMPDTGIQPRLALGFNLRALLKFMGRNDLLTEISMLTKTIDPGAYEERGRNFAKRLKGRIPIVYSSARNLPIAYNWKIKFNETGKIPAFYNVFPELNHNEMTGFDIRDSSRELSRNFHFIFLKDKDDHPRILKRMEVLEGLYKDRGLPVEVVEVEGLNIFHKIFSSLVLADWVAFYTAGEYGLEAEQVPMVEEFKRLIK